MNKLIFLMFAGLLLLTGCATQDATKEQGQAAVEQRDLLETQRKAQEEEARRRAQAAQDQEEINRRLDEERRRAAEEAAKAKTDAEIKALQQPTVTETSLSDPAAMLKDPSSPVYKHSIYYDFDRYDIREEFTPLVEAHAGFLMQHADLKARVEGNCDERGSTEYNLALGQRRADSVKKALVLLGVPANRVEAVSYGEEKPKAQGHDEEAYAENRRSDISYPGVE